MFHANQRPGKSFTPATDRYTYRGLCSSLIRFVVQIIIQMCRDCAQKCICSQETTLLKHEISPNETQSMTLEIHEPGEASRRSRPYTYIWAHILCIRRLNETAGAMLSVAGVCEVGETGVEKITQRALFDFKQALKTATHSSDVDYFRLENVGQIFAILLQCAFKLNQDKRKRPVPLQTLIILLWSWQFKAYIWMFFSWLTYIVNRYNIR